MFRDQGEEHIVGLLHQRQDIQDADVADKPATFQSFKCLLALFAGISPRPGALSKAATSCSVRTSELIR